MKRKSVFTCLIAFCLLVGSFLGLTACGDNSSPTLSVWERTWTYQNAIDGNWGQSGGGVDGNGNPIPGNTVETLLEREFDNFDLANAKAIRGESEEQLNLSGATNADILKNEIENRAKTFFGNELGGFKVTFSSKEEMKLVIDDITYVAKTGQFSNTYYEIFTTADDENKVGSFSEETYNIPNANQVLNFNINTKVFEFTVSIPTKTIVDDNTMSKEIDENGDLIKTSLNIKFTAFLSVENT